MRNHAEPYPRAQQARRELREAAAVGDRHTGPPPSFEVNRLEIDTDLQQQLARLEAERAHDRAARTYMADPLPDSQHEPPTDLLADATGAADTEPRKTPPET